MGGAVADGTRGNPFAADMGALACREQCLLDGLAGVVLAAAALGDAENVEVGAQIAFGAHAPTVLNDGYEWQGRPYQSLSAIARAITGTRWNGWRFFGLKSTRGRA